MGKAPRIPLESPAVGLERLPTSLTAILCGILLLGVSRRNWAFARLLYKNPIKGTEPALSRADKGWVLKQLLCCGGNMNLRGLGFGVSGRVKYLDHN